MSNFTHQIVTFEATGEELSFKTVVDTFSVTTQGVVGPAQSVELPIELSGVITPVGLRLEGEANGTCNAARATAVTDIYNLIAIFPARLSKGATWRDSTVVSACQAGIPTTTTTRRTFQISSEVIHSGRSLLLVTRADIINSRGAGAYNQHRMQVEGTGTGNALYYLDTRTGEVEHLVTAQTSEIQVATSGRLHSFTQSVNQEFVRAR